MYAMSNPYLPGLRVSRAPGNAGMLIAIALHASALVAVLSYEPARSALLTAGPIMVSWIAQPQVEPRRAPPKPKPVARSEPKPVEMPPMIAAEKAEPAAAEAPAPPPPAIVAVPQPVVSVPIFNADYLDNPSPPYPALSRRLQEQGRVLLRVLVSTEGRADQVLVQTSSGFARLDGSASETVKHWKFVPAKRGTESVPAWVLIPISFKLES